MNQERYWRNLLADEIKAEHDKVKKYYQKKGMNAGGMSPEEHTRLNIFLLCESIVRTMKDSQDAPREEVIPAPDVEPVKAEQPIKEEPVFTASTVDDNQITIEEIMQDPIQDLVKDNPYQNEFGEIL